MICLLSSDWLVVPTQSDGSFYTKPRNNLQLNADKSDVMTLGTAVQLRSVAAVTTVDVAGSQARDPARRHHRQQPTLRQARRSRRQGV